MVVLRQMAFAWFLWSDSHVSWVAMAISERREQVDGLHERFSVFFDAPSCVAVAASADDNDVEAAGRKLPFPGDYAGLDHERFGVE